MRLQSLFFAQLFGKLGSLTGEIQWSARPTGIFSDLELFTYVIYWSWVEHKLHFHFLAVLLVSKRWMFSPPSSAVNLLYLSTVFFSVSTEIIVLVSGGEHFLSSQDCATQAHASEHADSSNLLKMRQVTALSSHDSTMSPSSSVSHLKWLLLFFKNPTQILHQISSSSWNIFLLSSPTSYHFIFSAVTNLCDCVVFNLAQCSGKQPMWKKK